MLITKPTAPQTSPKFDATSKTPVNATREPSPYVRPEPAVDGASISKIYDPRNPTHAALKERNDQLAMRTGPLLRALKDESGIRGSTIFNTTSPDGRRMIMIGTATSHTVHFEGPPRSSVSIRNGEMTSCSGKISPITLNSNMSFLAAALQMPSASQILRKNG